jgi:DNA replication protein DnaC
MTAKHRPRPPTPPPPKKNPSSQNPLTLHDQVLADLAIFHIPLTNAELDAALDQAHQQGWSHLEFLQRLLAEQAGHRRARSIQRRIQAAHFRELKPMAEFNWNFNPTLPRTQIEGLLTCDFVRRRQNVVFVGQSGLGKSCLMQAIGQAACTQGFKVYYITSGALLEDLTAALADQTLPLRICFYTRFDLLIVDEFGFDRIERSLCPQAASLWYKVIDARSQKASTALVTNIDFDHWADYLGDAPLVMAFLDRIVDGALIVKMKGQSYRVHRPPDQPPSS